MRILYVGPLWYGGICEQRKRILEELGHKIFPIDTQTDWSRFSLKKCLFQVSYRMRYPLDLSGVNKKILRACESIKFDIIWIDKGQTIYASTLRLIKTAMPRVALVNFNPDDPFCPIPWGWGWLKKCVPLYDVCFVPREKSVEDYKKAGGKFVKRFYWGYSPHIHKPVNVTSNDRKKLGGNIGFIGTFERERAEAIQSLAAHGVPVRIWGEGWERTPKKPANLIIEGKPLWNENFAKAIRSFDINLCFLNKVNEDTLNTRCLAIPACGAFMLAERTTDLMELFEEGKEAEFFQSKEELFKKIAFYLNNPERRKKIAKAGLERCLKSGYSNHERLKELISDVKKLRAEWLHLTQ